MQTIQPPFSITEDMLTRVISGELNITGAVVRDNTGQIVKHLKNTIAKDPIDSSQIAHEVGQVSASVAKDTYKSLGAKFAIGSLVVAGLVAAGYGTYKLVTHLKKQTKEKEQNKIIRQNSGLIMYNPELTEYINNMQSQTMSLSSIKRAVEFFEKYSNDDLTIEISDEEMMVIRNIVVRYTIKLCESNNVYLDDKQLFVEAKTSDKNELLQEINYAFNIQEEIFSMA